MFFHIIGRVFPLDKSIQKVTPYYKTPHTPSICFVICPFNEQFFNTPFGIQEDKVDKIRNGHTHIWKLHCFIKSYAVEKETWKFYLSDVKVKRMKLNLLWYTFVIYVHKCETQCWEWKREIEDGSRSWLTLCLSKVNSDEKLLLMGDGGDDIWTYNIETSFQ